ncbi:hypothetical protein RND81_09G110800 [Saponaria officinalis]|uniref:Uncharacterized protein n=1 Tax=Saponaria officinalis TaxID=3572 RepID=A0AAW1ILF5_SAPOF
MCDVKSGTMDENFEKYIKQITDNRVAKADTGGGHVDNTVVTEGYLYNAHKEAHKELHIIDQHHWSGEIDPQWPFRRTLVWRPLNEIITFKHRGRFPAGSVAGVVYADGHGTAARKWLVAFDVYNRKIYVEAGPTGPVDWNTVKVKLDRSTDISEYVDPILEGTAGGYFRENRVYAIFSN